jgi:hypothetical protein
MIDNGDLDKAGADIKADCRFFPSEESHSSCEEALTEAGY